MAQSDLEVTIKFQKAGVYEYVLAMCAFTSEPIPVKGEVTVAQMRRLIRQTMNGLQIKYQRETNTFVPPEGAES